MSLRNKSDDLKQEKKSCWWRFLCQECVFLPSAIPISLLSFHLSYNYGRQHEPEVCSVFLKDWKGGDKAKELLQMKIWLQFFFLLVWMKPGSVRKVRRLTCTKRHRFDLSFFFSAQRVAHCSWKAYMWNHFLSTSAEFTVWPKPSWETKASSSLHRFPLALLCCSRSFAAWVVGMSYR